MIYKRDKVESSRMKAHLLPGQIAVIGMMVTLKVVESGGQGR